MKRITKFADVYKRQRFTLEQRKTLKTGKVSKREKTWHAGARHEREQKLIRGLDVINQESRTIHVTHQTDHRGFPANWQWRHYAHEWKQVMDASIGCNQEAVMAKPVSYTHLFAEEGGKRAHT